MKNNLAKLSVITLLTSIAFSSQSAIIGLTTLGSTDATISVSGVEETQQAVSGGNASTPTAVSEFSIFSQVPTASFSQQVSDLDSARSGASTAQTGEFNLSAETEGNAISHSALSQIYQVQNSAVAGNFLFNFQIQSGKLSANCGTGAIGNYFTSDSNTTTSDSTESSSAIDNGCDDNSAFSEYESTVTLFRNNSSEQLFHSSVSVSSDISGMVIETAGEVIGQQTRGGVANEAVFSINESNYSIDILDILANEIFRLEYRVTMMSKSIRGSLFESEESEVDVVSSPEAFVAFGDPNGFQGPNRASSTSLSRVSVSAPSSFLFLSFGLAALAFTRKRNAK